MSYSTPLPPIAGPVPGRPAAAPEAGGRAPQKTRLSLAFLAAGALVVVGCGRKDDPLPPLRVVPATTTDLGLHQQGKELILSMTYPQTTTSGAVLPGLDALEVWAAALPPGATAAIPPIDERTFARLARSLVTFRGAEFESSVVGKEIEARLLLPSDFELQRMYALAIRTLSSSGELSSFSNRQALLVSAPPFPPASLVVSPEPAGVRILFEPGSGDDSVLVGFSVYRRLATERRYREAINTVGANDRSYLDEGAKFGQRLLYTVRAVTSLDPLIESDASIEREIDYTDRFAPQPPAAVTTLPENGRVRLIIDRSPSKDVAGYRIYRRDPGADWRNLTPQPITALEFVDSGLAAGLVFSYRVTAVDNADNEGDPGPVVEVRVP